jgi:hypothetical protein
MSKETGGCAFPYVDKSQNSTTCEVTENYGDGGMTLRDYFAASAMQQLVVHSRAEHDGIARTCYQMADAMLKARAGE